jgi:Tripartite tricarboxylate transporter TctB family
VLGDTIERYLFISVGRYGIGFLARPVVAILFTIAIIGLTRPFLQDIRNHGGLKKMLTSFQAPRFQVSQLFTIFSIGLIATMVGTALRWDFSAKIVPLVVGTVALIAAGLSLFNDMCRKPESIPKSLADQAIREVERQIGAADQKMHMDLTSDTAHLTTKVIIRRAGRFFGYLISFMGVMAVIGLIPTVAVFVVFFMRYENQERWSLIIPYTVLLLVSISFIFDYIMSVPWPPTYIGNWFPALKFIPSV